jgi:hypothetical protein
MRPVADAAGSSGPLTPILTESPEPPKPARAEGDAGGNTTRPLQVTSASSKAPEPPPANSAATTDASKPESASLPAQIAREQIASGRAPEASAEMRARGKGQRMVGAARGVVEERLAPGVEKLRQASNVVWSEAQDDPNLRFILVAVFLFILAIVIIVLGTYLR